jgi:hypothetical protein
MTLILSFISNNYLIQVSDKSLFQIGNGTEISTNTNKAVLYCQQVAFGYTGISIIDNKATDQWLAEHLSTSTNKDLPDILQNIANSATTSFKKIRLPQKDKRHAFVGIGYVQLLPIIHGEKLQPIYLSITNSLDPSGNWMDKPDDKFTVWYKFLPQNEPFLFVSDGQILPNSTKRKLNSRIEKALCKNNPSRAIEWIFVNAIREQATKNSMIGKNITSISIPLSTIEEEEVRYQRKKAEPSNATFLSWIDGKPKQEFGPYLVCRDVLTDLKNIGDVAIYRGEKAREKSVSLAKPEEVKTTVLSPWTGLGIESSPHRPLISDEYALDFAVDITSQKAWPKFEECPYYGLLLSINSSTEMLNRIKRDHNYLIIYSEFEVSTEIPSEEWFEKLISWFSSQGMDEGKVESYLKILKGYPRNKVAETLIILLRSPKRYL